MLSLKLTGKLPFKQVFLHAIVRDAHGRKMSKALGNVIDPIDVIEGTTLQGLQDRLSQGNLDPREVEKAKLGQKKDYPNGISECGTDALRFALCSYTTHGRDINLDINKVVVFRNFCNKLWNATKFAMINLGDKFVPLESENSTGNESFIEKWILSRLNHSCITANESMKGFHIAEAVTAIYNFWLHELCDVYLEAMKPIMQQEGNETAKNSARNTLYTCLDVGLRLLAPFMPFVTEELFQRLVRRPNSVIESICITQYPLGNPSWSNAELEARIEKVMEVVRSIRSVRAAYKLAHKALTVHYIQVKNDEYRTLLTDYQSILHVPTLAFSASVHILSGDEKFPETASVKEVNEFCSVGVVIPADTPKLAEK